MKLPGLALSLAVAGFALILPEAAEAARINELSDSTLMDRAARFFTFKDPSLRNALAGSMLLGVCCGLMGAFLVVRKLSLLGDALSHAVLPGVALGFLWNMSKDPIAIFVGATLAGLLGAGTVQLLRATTKHKEDAALGFVLASFFGIGICLFTIAVFYKELLVTSFDPGLAKSLGMRTGIWHYGLMGALALVIVSAFESVGAILAVAMLIVPPMFAAQLSEWLPFRWD